MKESMPKMDVAPAPEKIETPQAVMEKCGVEREQILQRFVDRAINKFDEVIPEALNKPIKSVIKSTVVGHARMIMQAYKGVAADGRPLSRAERIARIMNTFTWAASYAVSLYCAHEGKWESVAIAQASTPVVAPINAFLNNEEEIYKLMDKIKDKIPLLKKINEVAEKQPVFAA